jgi:hypothetical protein
VREVKALDGFCVEVKFADGQTGRVEMNEFLHGDNICGTVFEDLRNPKIFAMAHVELGAVTWPNGADLAPDAMYDAIVSSGVWRL